MNGKIIPEEGEKNIEVQPENATFLILGDKAYTSEIIDEYNRNAEARTNEFNSNAADRTTDFNNNYDDKVAAFNSNAITKTDDFDNNATSKTEEYNANATTKETNFNSNVSASIASYNRNAIERTDEFNQNALSYKEGITEVSNRTYRIENDLFDSGEASGTSINLQDSTLAEFKEVSVDGVGNQNTTTGKNLLNVDKDFEWTGVYTINETIPAGTYKVTWKSSVLGGENDAVLSFDGALNESGSNTIIGLSPSGNTKTITLSKDVTKMYLYSNGYGYQQSVGITSSVQELMISINGGVYEPYTGGQPSPNPDYPQDIEVIEENFDLISCGKNLLNITTDFPKTSGSLTLSKNEDKTLQLTGNKTEEGWENLNFKLKEINFKKGNTYIIAKGITLKLAKKDDPTFYKNQSNKFVVTDDNIYCTSAYVSKYMVDNYNEKIYPYIAINDTFNELDFEPYIESRLPVKIPEGEFACKINDDVKDKLNIRFNESDGNYHLYLKKNVGKVVLDGSESYYTSEIYFFPDTITFRTTIEGDINHSRQSLCSHFIQTTNWNDISNGVDGKYQLYDTNGYFWFVVNKNIATNIDDLKTWLSENNVTIDYQLAEPYEIDLGKVEMPLSYYPITNVYTTCSLQPTIEVEYYRDFKNTIVELQDNQKEMEEQLADSIDRIEALETAIQSLQTSSIESEVVE